MRILAITTGEYGHRHLENIRRHGPESWEIENWSAPMILPPVIDYPEDFLPARLPQASLILSFAEHRGVAELLPEIATMTGAQSVIAAVDNEAWLPRGLARQLRTWLEELGITCVTPKPLCSLTENRYLLARNREIAYDDPRIAEFARYFGKPDLRIEVDPQTNLIQAVEVMRDAVCGCARFVATNLVGLSVGEAEEKGGLLHHHYPCMAAMEKDSDFGDTLMHVSGNILKDNIRQQIKPYLRTPYLTPGIRSEEKPGKEFK